MAVSSSEAATFFCTLFQMSRPREAKGQGLKSDLSANNLLNYLTLSNFLNPPPILVIMEYGLGHQSNFGSFGVEQDPHHCSPIKSFSCGVNDGNVGSLYKI